jgi:hypothetical protein
MQGARTHLVGVGDGLMKSCCWRIRKLPSGPPKIFAQALINVVNLHFAGESEFQRNLKMQKLIELDSAPQPQCGFKFFPTSQPICDQPSNMCAHVLLSCRSMRPSVVRSGYHHRMRRSTALLRREVTAAELGRQPRWRCRAPEQLAVAGASARMPSINLSLSALYCYTGTSTSTSTALLLLAVGTALSECGELGEETETTEDTRDQLRLASFDERCDCDRCLHS